MNMEEKNTKWKYKGILILAAAASLGLIAVWVFGNLSVHRVTGIKNPDGYILEFEKMNQKDSCVIPALREDVFAVHFRINQGHADLIIGMDGRKPIYTGNDIETGEFDVIVPEDGEYRITINAKHASGSVEVYAKKGEA